MNRDKAFQMVSDELDFATKKFGSFSSAHEGYAIIQEEVDELWDEIKTKGSTPADMHAEAKQVAAMGIRFLMDIDTDEIKS